ncbi:hypothetical protein Tco_0537586 [Tanacetum coccineum]
MFILGKASVLVNASPSKDFPIQRGLRQGDHPSPFLFIQVMEGLNVTIEDATMPTYFMVPQSIFLASKQIDSLENVLASKQNGSSDVDKGKEKN